MSAPELSIVMRPIAVTREQAAAALAMSVDSFERYVQPNLRLIRKGKLRLVPVSEIEAWCEANAAYTLNDESRRNGWPSHATNGRHNGRGRTDPR